MKKFLSLILAFSLCLSFVGCGGAEAAGVGNASGSVSAADSGAAASQAELLAAEAEAEKDVETTVTVTLSDGAPRADGAGVAVAGDKVTVTSGGSYRVTGTLTNGQIVVNAPEETVVLALDGASVACENSAALYVVAAKKVVLSLVSGSENALASTGEYVQTDDNTVDAALFSKDDLTIKGSGALAVSSETGHGIVSKDELKIQSGTLTVTAAKKGLAANDLVEITGGETYVSGSTNSGNGAFDYAGAGTITGGTVIAAGSSGMAQSLSSDTQGVALLTLSGTQSAGSAVTLKDANGALLASFTPEKPYSSVVISAPGMESGGTYAVACGSESRSITLEGFAYSEDGFSGFGGGKFGGMGSGFGGGRPEGDFDGGRPDGTPPSGFSGGKPSGTPPAGFPDGGSAVQSA